MRLKKLTPQHLETYASSYKHKKVSPYAFAFKKIEEYDKKGEPPKGVIGSKLVSTTYHTPCHTLYESSSTVKPYLGHLHHLSKASPHKR